MLDFVLEADFIALLKSHVEIRGVKNLSQFFLNGAEDFILVKMRANGLPNLSEQFVFFGSPLSVMNDNVVFQREANL